MSRTETTTVTVGGVLTPDTTVTRTIIKTDAGAIISKEYRSEMTILGVDPVRGTTVEERELGIEQLSLPITVATATPEDLVKVAKEAATAAVHFTEGQEMTIPKLAFTEYLVGRAIKKALRDESMAEDV